MNKPPIFFVCGAFGTGKSTLAPLVADQLRECYVLDADWLMDSLSALSGRNLYEDAAAWPALGEVWFAIAGTHALASRSSVIFSPAEPHELEGLPLRDHTGAWHWLMLDCDDAELCQRLTRRNWSDGQIAEALTDAARMRTLGLERLHTDTETPKEAAQTIVAWVRRRLP